MSLEAQMGALVESINALTAAYQGGANAPAAPAKPVAKKAAVKKAAAKKAAAKQEPDPLAEDETVYCLDDVRELATAVIKAEMKPAAIEVMEAHGVKKITELEPAQFASVIAGLNALLDESPV